MNKQTKKITFLGIAVSLAMILSYVEMLLPPIWSAVPSIKMGLPNVITTFVLYKLSWKESATISLVRILLTAILFGNAMTLLYSLAGAFLSLTAMALLKKVNVFSVVGVSITGGVLHNLGQILIAILLLQNKEIGYYMAILIITGTVAGALIGIFSVAMLKYSEKIKIKF